MAIRRITIRIRKLQGHPNKIKRKKNIPVIHSLLLSAIGFGLKNIKTFYARQTVILITKDTEDLLLKITLFLLLSLTANKVLKLLIINVTMCLPINVTKGCLRIFEKIVKLFIPKR